MKNNFKGLLSEREYSTLNVYFIISLLLVCIFVLSINWFPVTDYIPNRDNALFSLSGELIRKGGIPYESYWDHKPPIIHFLNAAALITSGGSIWGIWILSLLALLSSVLSAYLSARALYGQKGVVAGSAFAILGLWPFFQANLTEQYAMPLGWFTILISIGWAKSRISDGLFGGVTSFILFLCFMLRQNLIAAPLSFILVSFIFLVVSTDRERVVSFSLSSVAGFAGPAIATTGFFWTLDVYDSFIDQAFTYNFVYSSAGWVDRLDALVTGVGLLPLGGLVGAAWLFFVVSNHQSFNLSAKGNTLVVAIALWLPLEFGMASISGREYPHYFMTVIPPASLVFGYLGEQIHVKGLPPQISFLANPSVLLCGALIISSLSTPQVVTEVRSALARLTSSGSNSITHTVSVDVRSRTNRDDHIFVWGSQPSIYLFADRPPASRFVYVYPILTTGYTGEKIIGQLMSDLRSTPPKVIIDASAGSPDIPTLTEWQPSWVSGSYAVPPELRSLYKYVRANYTRANTKTSQWPLYIRTTSTGFDSEIGSHFQYADVSSTYTEGIPSAQSTPRLLWKSRTLSASF
ncbi:hypothetical protein [Salinibacter ruber]|uniref:hypothetical protein n=1 Tax=Salinibacter ruber TaxID=146919 RepID=UPI0013C32537|nr:hypothetical protein [Salinibacter ruber]